MSPLWQLLPNFQVQLQHLSHLMSPLILLLQFCSRLFSGKWCKIIGCVCFLVCCLPNYGGDSPEGVWLRSSKEAARLQLPYSRMPDPNSFPHLVWITQLGLKKKQTKNAGALILVLEAEMKRSGGDRKRSITGWGILWNITIFLWPFPLFLLGTVDTDGVEAAKLGTSMEEVEADRSLVAPWSHCSVSGPPRLDFNSIEKNKPTQFAKLLPCLLPKAILATIICLY